MIACQKNFWPYKDGLVHVYGQKKDMTYKNRNKFADHIDFNKEQPFVFLIILMKLRTSFQNLKEKFLEKQV